MRIHVAGAIAAAVLLSSPAAFAADPVTDIAPVNDWSGFYVGVHGGYAWGDADVNDGYLTWFGVPFAGPLANVTDFDLDGGLGGVQAGFQTQSGNFVWGVEADASLTDISGDDGFVTTEINWLATLRGRIGYAFDNFLIYATAGGAAGETESGLTFGVDPTDEEIHFGWTAGAGAEVLVTENISLKAEYLYVDLGDETYTADLFIPGFLGVQGDVDLTTHIGRVGLNYRF
jgi:outer membrane immunogenic protein